MPVEIENQGRRRRRHRHGGVRPRGARRLHHDACRTAALPPCRGSVGNCRSIRCAISRASSRRSSGIYVLVVYPALPFSALWPKSIVCALGAIRKAQLRRPGSDRPCVRPGFHGEFFKHAAAIDIARLCQAWPPATTDLVGGQQMMFGPRRQHSRWRRPAICGRWAVTSANARARPPPPICRPPAGIAASHRLGSRRGVSIGPGLSLVPYAVSGANGEPGKSRAHRAGGSKIAARGQF